VLLSIISTLSDRTRALKTRNFDGLRPQRRAILSDRCFRPLSRNLAVEGYSSSMVAFKYFLVPARIERRASRDPDRGLKAGSKLMYAVLLAYGGLSDRLIYPSLATLGSHLGVGDQQARRYLQELEKRGLIQASRGRGEYGTNFYYFLDEHGKRYSGWKPGFKTGRKEHASKIPVEVMESTDLAHEAKLLYGWLGRFQYRADLKDQITSAKDKRRRAKYRRGIQYNPDNFRELPPPMALMHAIGVSTYRVRQYLAQLERNGLLLLNREKGTKETLFRVIPPSAGKLS